VIVLAALIGLAFGQALPLVFDRLYTGESWAGPVHRCSSCGRTLPLAFLVPGASFLLGRGRCPGCRSMLPWRAIVLPLGSAALFLAAALVFDDFGPALLAGFFATVFLLLTLTDLDRRLIPNRVVYPSVLLAAALSWAWPEASALQVLAGGLVAVGIGVAILAFSLPFGANAFGMGDVKMIILIGMVVGLPAVLVGVFLGTVAAGAGAALLLVSRRVSRRDYIPHGPFLALGGVVALFWGQEVWDWYFDR
jgi:prepilin signal peptidase PulO-like enzyme (type II secretory pathway)